MGLKLIIRCPLFFKIRVDKGVGSGKGFMRDIIDWLIDFEKTAAKFYYKAAAYFFEDRELSELARVLAKDEEWHAEIMGKALEHLKDHRPPDSLLRVDVELKEEIYEIFKKCEAGFESGTVTDRDFLDGIVKAEFSEWNTYLMYVVTSLKEFSDEFADVPMRMQEHKGRIESFVKDLSSTHPEATAGLLERLGGLPDVWRDRFLLVVDDDDAITDLLKAILSAKGVVDCASDGKEALEKFNLKYYDVIVMDVDMPRMSGLEFYELAARDNADLKERILFFTGNDSKERLAFFRDNGLKYLKKPALIEDIVNAVSEILKA